MNLEEKRESEKDMVSDMIRIYCHGVHHTKKGQMCEECAELNAYARDRSDHCPFMETKTFCSSCKVHCYAPEKRQAIKAVMRYAGPRMLLVNPLAALRHVFTTIESKKG